MKIQLNGLTYTISFSHSSEYHPGMGGKVVESTTCFISLNNATIALGTVTRHHKDAPNRVIARKRAMAKALADGGFSKSDREVFWLECRKQMRLVGKDRGLNS